MPQDSEPRTIMIRKYRGAGHPPGYAIHGPGLFPSRLPDSILKTGSVTGSYETAVDQSEHPVVRMCKLNQRIGQ
jgi:hypothetical protein